MTRPNGVLFGKVSNVTGVDGDFAIPLTGEGLGIEDDIDELRRYYSFDFRQSNNFITWAFDVDITDLPREPVKTRFILFQDGNRTKRTLVGDTP